MPPPSDRSSRRFDSILHPTPDGLWCPGGAFFIDPPRPVDRAVITHGHADHARAGHGSVLATPETLAIMRERYGQEFAVHTQALAYGERIRVGDVDLSLAPAGAKVILLGSYEHAQNAQADVFIPISIQTERSGHYTNFAGVVTPFEACFPLKPSIVHAEALFATLAVSKAAPAMARV